MADKHLKGLGELLKELAAEKGKSPADLAAAAQMTTTQMYRVLGGQSGTRPQALRQIARALDLTAADDRYRLLFDLAGHEPPEFEESLSVVHALDGLTTLQSLGFDTPVEQAAFMILLQKLISRPSGGVGDSEPQVIQWDLRELRRAFPELAQHVTLATKAAEVVRHALAQKDRTGAIPYVPGGLTLEDVGGIDEDIVTVLNTDPSIDPAQFGTLLMERIHARARWHTKLLKTQDGLNAGKHVHHESARIQSQHQDWRDAPTHSRVGSEPADDSAKG